MKKDLGDTELIKSQFKQMQDQLLQLQNQVNQVNQQQDSILVAQKKELEASQKPKEMGEIQSSSSGPTLTPNQQEEVISKS